MYTNCGGQLTYQVTKCFLECESLSSTTLIEGDLLTVCVGGGGGCKKERERERFNKDNKDSQHQLERDGERERERFNKDLQHQLVKLACL